MYPANDSNTIVGLENDEFLNNALNVKKSLLIAYILRTLYQMEFSRVILICLII